MDSEHHRVGVQTMIVQNFIPSAIEVLGVPPRLDIPDGGLPAGLSPADVHRSIVGAGLPAKAAWLLLVYISVSAVTAA